jgi:O-antigen ligase
VALPLAGLLAGVSVSFYPAEVLLIAGLITLVSVAYKFSFVVSTVLFSGIALVFADPGVATVSHMGMLTISVAGGSWLLWATRGAWSRETLVIASPLILLLIMATVTLAWSPNMSAGVQQTLILASFVGVMLLSAEQARSSFRFQFSVQKSIVIATVLSSGAFILSYVVPAIRDFSIGPARQTFVLLAVVGVSCLLANWRYGSKSSLYLAAIIIAVIALSTSRTAFVVGLLLVPLARIDLRSIRGWLGFSAWTVTAVVILQILVTRVEAMRSRFFEGDLAINIAGIPINAMGRVHFWTVTLESFQEAPWLGQGAGSAQLLMDQVFGTDAGVDHPHNEFLRYLHDVGLIGVSLLALGLIILLVATFRFWLSTDASFSGEAATHLAAFLSLIAVILVMLTDNPLVYLWVMVPLGALVGASVGRGSLAPSESYTPGCNSSAHPHANETTKDSS